MARFIQSDHRITLARLVFPLVLAIYEVINRE